MPTLLSLLKSYDLNFLRQLAALWDVPATGADKRAYAISLAKLLQDERVFEEIFESLPEQATEALKAVKQIGGEQSWSAFARAYGGLRVMGPAKRDREQPWFFPSSTAEYLYYRGFIGREFIRKDEGLLESAFIPDEFLALLPDVPEKESLSIGASLTPQPSPSSDQILDTGLGIVDDYCTLFAALRLGVSDILPEKTGKPDHYWRCLRALGDDLGVLGEDGLPTDVARALLERPKVESAAWVAGRWATTREFNELRLTPSFRCEGSWRNKPFPARRALLAWLGGLQVGKWYLLNDLVAWIEENQPDFLRQGADYDLWLIYSVPSGRLLKGLQSWHSLEPVFLSFFVTQWMAWLGLTKSAQNADGALFFSLNPVFFAMLEGRIDSSLAEKEEALKVFPNGLIVMSQQTAPIARYQISRFAEWLDVGPRQFRFQITPRSLARAAKAKLNIRQLISLLRKYGSGSLPPVLLNALHRWQEFGTEAKAEDLTVLRLKSPEILQALKQSAAKTWLGDVLGPVSVVIKPGGLKKVQEALVQLGYLSDLDVEGNHS